MSTEQTVAPKERVNITYKSATGDEQEEVELPLKILAVGDYTGRRDDSPIEERKPINIDKDNFNQVMAEQELRVTMQVANKLDDAAEEMPVDLRLQTLGDFSPEGVVSQVPELKRLLELREALTAVKGPLGNTPAFRQRLQQLIQSADSRAAVLAEVGLARLAEGGSTAAGGESSGDAAQTGDAAQANEKE